MDSSVTTSNSTVKYTGLLVGLLENQDKMVSLRDVVCEKRMVEKKGKETE